jgi:predicted RNA-binding protein (virulence factor B family)
MTDIGKYNTLAVLRKLDFGFYLDGSEAGDILLPLRYAPENCKPGDKLDVFIYFDSEDRIIATTERPLAKVGEFAYLRVVSVNSVGAFLDWGLPKDLLVPFREQKQTMEEGKSYIVFIYIDTESNRIAASAKLGQFLNLEPVNYLEGDEVDLMIISHSELGYKAVINGRHEGILYENEVFQPLRKGQQIKGFIKKVRVDGKIDLRLLKDGYQKVDSLTENILEVLENNDGFIAINDKSPAEDIYRLFGMSKKTFKKAAGALFKARLISIGEEGISLLQMK